MGAKIARWLLFSVAFSLVPIIANYLLAVGKSSKAFPPLSTVIQHGELFLLSTGLAAVGLGEVIGANQRAKIIKIITGGVSSINMLLSTLLFATLNNTPDELATSYFSYLSFWIFLFTCVVATSCVVLSEIGDA
jgi:hypothetical protein